MRNTINRLKYTNNVSFLSKLSFGNFFKSLCFVMLFSPLWAAEYVVSSSGDNGNAGNLNAPWRTIQYAANKVKAGDRVTVKSGTYNEVVKVSHSGKKDSLIVFVSEQLRKAKVQGFVLKGDYIQVEGFEITHDKPKAIGIDAGQASFLESVKDTASKGCRMINNYIHDVDGRSIYSGTHALVKGNLLQRVGNGIFANSHSLVEDNEIDTLLVKMVEKKGKIVARGAKYAFFSGEHIHFRGNYFHGTDPTMLTKGLGTCFFGSWDAWKYGPSKHILIENNRCFNATHASEPSGTAHKQSSHITYRNNLFFNTAHVGALPMEWSNIKILNNTFINCGAYPVWFQKERETEGSVVKNNLFTYYKYKPIAHAPESGIRIDSHLKGRPDIANNMYWKCRNRKYVSSDFTAEPIFVDPDNGDFRLKAGSPGIDVGANLSGMVDFDQNGVKRPQGEGFDIGCYELK